jgi:LPXTG-motif cell wall-anchored protein
VDGRSAVAGSCFQLPTDEAVLLHSVAVATVETMDAETEEADVVIALKPTQLAGAVALLLAGWYVLRRRRRAR